MGHQRPIWLGMLEPLNDVMSQQLQRIAGCIESPANDPFKPPDPSIMPAGKHANITVGPIYAMKPYRHISNMRRDDMDAADHKRMIMIRLVFDVMMPGQHNPIIRHKIHLPAVDQQPPTPLATPQKHPAFNPRAHRPFPRRELIPVGQDNDRGGFDGFIHALSIAGHV